METAEWKSQVIESLRRRIGGAGLTLTALDSRLGWRAGTTSQALTGRLPLRIERLYEILTALDCSLTEFFGELEGFGGADSRDGEPSHEQVLDLLDRRVREAVSAELDRRSSSGLPSSLGASASAEVASEREQRFRERQRAEISVDALIDRIFEMTPDEREVAVGTDPAFHHLRLAQRLLESSREKRHGSPQEAESLARLALTVIDHLSVDDVGPSTAEDVRLRAWTYVATARTAAGELVGAAEALRIAENVQESGSEDAHLAALVLEAKAILRRNQGEFDESERLLVRARERFAALGAEDAVHRSSMNLANVYCAQGRFAPAATLLTEALEEIDEKAFPDLALQMRHNLIAGLVDAGELVWAQTELDRSKSQYAQHADSLTLARRTWIEAQIAASTSRSAEAEKKLREVLGIFVEADIGFDAALAALELATLYLDRNDSAAAQALAGDMLPIFQAQDLHRHALAALTVFQQAASQARLSVSLVAHIKSFLDRARNDPSLTYEPPGSAET